MRTALRLYDYWEWVRTTQGYLYSLNSNDTDEDGILDGDEDLDTDGLTNLEVTILTM